MKQPSSCRQGDVRTVGMHMKRCIPAHTADGAGRLACTHACELDLPDGPYEKKNPPGHILFALNRDIKQVHMQAPCAAGQSLSPLLEGGRSSRTG